VCPNSRFKIQDSRFKIEVPIALMACPAVRLHKIEPLSVSRVTVRIRFRVRVRVSVHDLIGGEEA